MAIVDHTQILACLPALSRGKINEGETESCFPSGSFVPAAYDLVPSAWSFIPSLKNLDANLASVGEQLGRLVFLEVGGFPLIVLWLVAGGVFLSFRLNWVNLWGVKHALEVVLGKYDEAEQAGEVSYFAALMTSLSATVGLGNVAGVAIAIALGGAGAAFWLTVAGVLGMATKFAECSLAQKYRQVLPDGKVVGGPMYYISVGLAKRGWEPLGRVLALSFTLCALGAGLVSSSLFQSNQSYLALGSVFATVAGHPWVYGGIVALAVGAVTLGGLQRIAIATEAIVPSMCAVYSVLTLAVVVLHWQGVPGAIALIFEEALSPEALAGGAAGAMVQGLRRGAFSNGMGVGIGGIAHATAKTKEPIREGFVALLEPLVDTIVLCNLTAIAILVAGMEGTSTAVGAALVSQAFGATVVWFPAALAVILFLFAYSTMLSWGYFGEVCWHYLFGQGKAVLFKLLYLGGIVVGAAIDARSLVYFFDAMYLLTSLPNLLAIYLLSPELAADLQEYWQGIKAEGR